jgi:hypothetical protein
MSKLKLFALMVFLMCFEFHVQAQQMDSIAKKGIAGRIWNFSGFNFKSKKSTPTKIVTDATKVGQGTIGESLNQVAKKTTLSVMTGVNFSKQSISASGYNSNFNYNISEQNDNLFKPGFFAGVRMDGSYHQQHDYSLSASLHKINSGVNYTSYKKIAPYMGKFSSFKGEDNLMLLNVAAHYKKILPIGDRVRYQLYVIGGPSVDVNVGGTSIDNQITGAYKKIFFKGDVGLEFYNRTNYNLFFHYHQSLHSITGSPISTNLNGFEFGMMVKAKDLF